MLFQIGGLICIIELLTDRLIIRSDALIVDGNIAFPPQKHVIDILNMKTLRKEDGGFAFYLRSNPSIQAGQFVFRNDRYEYEISYETNPPYRRQHYMQEALETFIPWFFDNTTANAIYGIIDENNESSEKLAMKIGFKHTGICYGGSPVYILNRPNKHNSLI